MVEPDKEYELVPEQEIHELREEMEALKHAYLSDGTTESSTVIEAIDKLSSQIHHLIAIFEHAGKHIDENSVKDFKKEVQSLDKISEQNDKIAKGLLKVAGMVKEIKHDNSGNVNSGVASTPSEQNNGMSAENPMQNTEMSNVWHEELQHAFDTSGVASSFGEAPQVNDTPQQQGPPPSAFDEQQAAPGTPSIPTQPSDPFAPQPAFDNNPFSPMPSSSEPMPSNINISGQESPPPPPSDFNSLAPGGLSGNKIPSPPSNIDSATKPHETFEEFKARKLAEKNAKK